MCEETCEHKPQPLPYLLAAERLGVSPHECVAFEDTISGTISAQVAGMRVVVLRSDATAQLPTTGFDSRAGGGSAAREGDVPPVLALVDDFDELPRGLLGLDG